MDCIEEPFFFELAEEEEAEQELTPRVEDEHEDRHIARDSLFETLQQRQQQVVRDRGEEETALGASAVVDVASNAAVTQDDALATEDWAARRRLAVMEASALAPQGGAEAAAGSGLERAFTPGWSAPQCSDQLPAPLFAEMGSEQMPPHLEGTGGTLAGEMAPMDVHADRHVISTAATIGSVAGTFLLGPTAGVALGAAALYAAAREDSSGALVRRASVAWLKATDSAIDGCVQAMDQGVKKLGQVAERGCQQLSTEVDLASMPAPVRAGVAAVLRSQAKAKGATGSWEEARRILERHPDRVPVICERSPYALGLPELDASKFLVPGRMICGEFKYMIHRQLARARSGRQSAEQTIYVFVDGLAPKTSTPMSDLYAKFCAEDGFLYITYSAENTLG